MNRKQVVLTALVWGLAVAAGAQSVDQGLKAQLADAGLQYDVTKAGNAKVVFTEEGGRSQEVYLRGTTDLLNGLVLREIWSIAGTLDPEPDNQALLDLLTEGGNETLGAWNLEKSDDGWLVYYSAKLPADLAGTDLRSALEAIAGVADKKEQALFDTDEN